MDDEEEVRTSVGEFLVGQGYDAVEAADGEEALAKCFTEKPDLLLLDLRLPKVDGYQVCQTLKGNPITSVIPIIMITALNSTSQKVKGIEYGADDYIEKPFDLEELSARMKMVLRRRRAAGRQALDRWVDHIPVAQEPDCRLDRHRRRGRLEMLAAFDQ